MDIHLSEDEKNRAISILDGYSVDKDKNTIKYRIKEDYEGSIDPEVARAMWKKLTSQSRILAESTLMMLLVNFVN